MTRSGSRLVYTWLLLCSLALAAGPLRAQEQPSPSAVETTDNGTVTVTVEGVDGPLRDNVLAHLNLNRFAGKPAPDETQLRWLHASAEREIRDALEPFGYYEPTLEASLNHTTRTWEARYRIQPGRPLLIASVDIQVLGEGKKDPAFQKLLDNPPLHKGQTLDQPRYEQLKQTLETLATERGYFDARFVEHTIRVDLQRYEAAVSLHYDTGKRYRFGAITFKQDILSPGLLARYPRFKPDDPYDSNDLLKLQSDLNNSPYFSQVQVTAPPDAATATAPIDVELEPNKQHKYSAGLGYGTDTGPRGKLRTEQRWVNQWGHHYEAEMLLSPVKSSIGGKYIIPGWDPTTDEYAVNASYEQQNYKQQDYNLAKLGGSWQTQDGKWLKNYSLNYQYEEYSVGDVPTSTSLLLVPGLSWTWVDADDRLNTRRGLLFGFELRGASTTLLSDITFVQGVMHLKGVYALNDTSRILARGDLGATAIAQDFEELPASLRFFTGGDASVRGYAYNSIGPADTQGDIIGGKNLLVGSLEYEHRIWDGWSLATFVDSGDAFDGSTPAMKTGVGIGLRWRSPVGPVRIDFASGLDRPPGDTFRFSFSVGPDL